MDERCIHEMVSDWCGYCNGVIERPAGLLTIVITCIACSVEFTMPRTSEGYPKKCPDCQDQPQIHIPSQHKYDPAILNEFGSWEDDYSEDSLP